MKSPHRLLSRVALALLMGLAGAAALAVRAQAQQKFDSNNPVFRDLSSKLLCQCGSCNYLAGSCNHLDCASATYIRKTIQNDLAEGKSEDVILASFVQQYGPKVLSEPPRHGFTLLAWIMPFFGLAFGGGAVSYVLWKWAANRARGKAALASGPRAAELEDPLLEKYRARIDREMEKD